MIRKLWLAGGIGFTYWLFFLVGCECQKCSEPCPMQKDQGCEQVITDAGCEVPGPQEKLNCPACRNEVVIYTRDGKTETNCAKCEVTQREKVCLECRPPKMTPKASSCPPCP